MSPGFSFGRTGGTNDTNSNLQDTNFLGWGKTLQFAAATSIAPATVAWSDPNVFGSRWTTTLAYSIRATAISARCRSRIPSIRSIPAEREHLRVSFDRTVSRYNLGNIVDQFNDNENQLRTERRRLQRPDRRLDQALDLRNALRPQPVRADAASPTLPAKQLPPDRTLSYPVPGFRRPAGRLRKVGD